MDYRLITPRELAKAIGASESSVRRWVDGGNVHLSRTVGGHRRITVAEAVRFIRETRSPLLRPELLGLPGDVAGTRNGTSEEALATALETGDANRFRSLAIAWYLSGRGLAELFDGPVRRAMNRVGAGWRDQEEMILAEHRATEACAQAVSQLRMLMPAPLPGAPLALGGAMEGDAHALASHLAATVLAEEGYRDVNFGGNTPVRLLLRAAAEQRPRLVWLSMHIQAHGRLVREIGALADDLHRWGAPLVVGGVHTRALPRHSNLHVAGSMSELGAFARGLLSASPRPLS